MALGEAILGAAGIAGGAISNAQQLAESKRGRQWSATMAGSAYQRAVIDLKAAGLNPMLAYMQGGAATPGASTAGGLRDPVTPGVSTARESMVARKQMQLLDQQIDKTRGEASSAAAQAGIDFTNQKMAMAKYDYYFAPDGSPREPLKQLLAAEFGSSMANSARSVSDAQLAAFSVPERKAIAELFSSAGSAGKGVQLLLPLLQTIIGRR